MGMGEGVGATLVSTMLRMGPSFTPAACAQGAAERHGAWGVSGALRLLSVQERRRSRVWCRWATRRVGTPPTLQQV